MRKRSFHDELLSYSDVGHILSTIRPCVPFNAYVFTSDEEKQR